MIGITMKKLILLLLIIFIPVITLAQTAEDYVNKGVAKYEKGDYRGAIQDFNKAIELKPNDALLYGLRGSAKIRLGQIDSGCLDLSKAGELGEITAYDMIKQYCQ